MNLRRNTFQSFLLGLVWLVMACIASADVTAGSPPQRGTVVILGDSLAAGYGLDLSEAFPSLLQSNVDAGHLYFTIVNAGVSGDTTAGGLRRINWLLKRKI